MKPPAGLGNRGRAVFSGMLKTLPDDFEFDDRELAILTMAARQADDVERLERAIKKDGTMVRGSTGQLVVNPAIGEARHGRLAITRMLGQLSLPDDVELPRTSTSRRAQKAARTRWDLDARRRAHGAA